MTLIYKIVPRIEWENSGPAYGGSAHDARDGFLHFSTGPQLAETFARHYNGQTDLLLVAVEGDGLESLTWERAPTRGEDFPHLYRPLQKSDVLWVKPIPDGGPLPTGAVSSPA